MDNAINEIKREAAKRGACCLINKAYDVKTLAEIFFSPQGKEFCEKNEFPPLRLLRALDRDALRRYGIYVDCGKISLRNDANIAIAGDTQAEIEYRWPDQKRTAIVMHGASASIAARNHAVAEVINIGGCAKLDFDKTAVLL